MKKVCSIFILFLALCGGFRLYSQPDSLVIADSIYAKDTMPPLHLKRYSLGGQFSNFGTIQYFDGYTREIMYLNAQSGLPLYNDWPGYSNFTIFPTFFNVMAHMTFVDTARGMRVRLGGVFTHREDSMAYRSGFSLNDTIFGRDGSEVSNYVGVTGSIAKQTKPLLKVFRAYAGVELELDVAWTSKIRLIEFSYDYGDSLVLELNEFPAKGRARMNFFGGALLGLETKFFQTFGVFAETRSGFGFQWILQEKPIGISRINIGVGVNYYFREKGQK